MNPHALLINFSIEIHNTELQSNHRYLEGVF